MTKNHLVIAVLILIVVLFIQTYYIRHIQNEYAEKIVNSAIEEYSKKQSVRDSLEHIELKKYLELDKAIEKHYYHTKEIITQDNEEKFKKYTDSMLTVYIDSLITKQQGKLRELFQN